MKKMLDIQVRWEKTVLITSEGGSAFMNTFMINIPTVFQKVEMPQIFQQQLFILIIMQTEMMLIGDTLPNHC